MTRFMLAKLAENQNKDEYETEKVFKAKYYDCKLHQIPSLLLANISWLS